MTERTDALVRALSRDLPAVQRLPRLTRVAARVLFVALVLAAARLAVTALSGAPILKPNFASVDAETIAVHVLLAIGALAFALGALVPGRERLARFGAIGAGLAALGLIWIADGRLEVWGGWAALEPGWVGATLTCFAGAIVPAAIPALLLTRFAARAAPHRPVRALLLGTSAAIAPLALPGIVSCGYPDELHHVLGHAFAPAIGAGVLALLVLPVFFRARASASP